MDIGRETVFVPDDRVAFREIGQSFVLVNIEDNKLLRLNDVGSTIWNALEGNTVGELLSLVVEEYEVVEKDAEKDLLEFLQDLIAWGLVKKKE